MECNRDEAFRAKEIAERKFSSDDFIGAKKFALKAQGLYPGLEGIVQMIATVDVHIASRVKVAGEKDWYAILSVSTSADDDTIKKQYRKLALQLHPDKNKTIGAEGAFQLVSEAWNVLSDKSKRALYDQKRNIRVFKQSCHTTRQNSAPNSVNGFYNFATNAAAKLKVHKQTPSSTSASCPSSWSSAAHVAQYASSHGIRVPPPTSAAPRHVVVESNLGAHPRVVTPQQNAPPPPRKHKPETFWTLCSRCKIQYEYLRLYHNQNILCPKCKEPFLASEIPKPSMESNAAHQFKNSSATQKVQTSNNFQWAPFLRTAGAASASASSVAAAQAANMVHQTYEKVKREREEAQAAAKERRRLSSVKRGLMASENATVAGGPPVKKLRTLDNMDVGVNPKVSTGNNPATATSEFPEVFSTYGMQGNMSSTRYCRQINLTKQFALLDIKAALIKNARNVLQEKITKLDGKFSSDTEEKVSKMQKLQENDKDSRNGVVHGVNDSTDAHNNAQVSKSNGTLDSNNDQITYTVPDPDFYNFDGDRLEKSFESDQIWATYDDEDGMPRYYAFVQKVISVKPFKIRMSFLTSKTNSEFGKLNWVASGFPKSCGELRIGRYETNQTLNMFSHKVHWEKGPRGAIRIFPKQGDVWALYRNWSPDWNEHTSDEVIYSYDMVEVLDNYSDQQGIYVAPLIKVAGFKTVFRRISDKEKFKRIPKEEMFRFSHQVPFYKLSGKEADNIPRDCYELDPAATPKELLQVIVESNGELKNA